MSIRDVVLSAVLLGSVLTGCKLLNTSDDENIAGRGATAFDPYRGPDSGAIRLALQMYNGCAYLPTGEPVGKAPEPAGNEPLKFDYPYPSECKSWQVPGQAPATEPLVLITETDYFVNQLTFMQGVENQHNDPRDMGSVIRWFRESSDFATLDWTNIGKTGEVWTPTDEVPNPNAFLHRVIFSGANWMNATDDSFLVEVLDRDGTVRASQTHQRSEFLAENLASGHTQVAWDHRYIGPPKFPGDLEVHPPEPAGAGFPPAPPPKTYTYMRFDTVLSTAPQKTLRISRALAGEGVIRVTWSAMKGKPFHFPVRFVNQDTLPKTCFIDGDVNKPVTCAFGLEPVATISTPANGRFFVPGEKVSFSLGIKDGAGSYIHPKDSFPSFHDVLANQGNGLSYFNALQAGVLMEKDNMTSAKVAGPLQDLDVYYEEGKAPFFQNSIEPMFLTHPAVAADALPGGRDVRPPTTWTFTLPQDARPGTYALYWKVVRNFHGERFSRGEAFYFPVGQEEPTSYPGEIGNCQICHRGQLSMENIRHGFGVDHVEGCVACHTRDNFPVARASQFERIVHDIHMNSPKYSLAKNDCGACHLTRAGATRPSMAACMGCHPAPHGVKFDGLNSVPDTDPGGVFGNCATACHATTLPTGHIYPEQ